MHNSIDKNRGAHGDSSFMLGGLPSSRENHLPFRHEECHWCALYVMLCVE